MTAIAWAQRGIERLDPADLPLLQAFQQASFGANSLQVQADYHRWIFEEVPYPDPEGPQLWVCKRGGAIVGQQGGIPFPLHVGDAVTQGSWAIDLMVLPEWRLRGVGPALSEAHAVANPVPVSLGMTEALYASYKRTGWLDLGTVPTWVRPIDVRRSLRVSPVKNRLVNAAGALGGPLLAAASIGGSAAVRLGGAALEEVPAFDERADALWEAARRQHAVIARRDLRALRWRFDAPWPSPRLRRFFVMRRGEPMAYLVLRVDSWKGEPVGVVIDYLARAGWTAPAFLLAIERARRERLIALLCRTLNARAERTFAALGFLCLRSGVRQPTHVMARFGHGGEGFRDLAGNPRNWFITAADSDIGFKDLGA